MTPRTSLVGRISELRFMERAWLRALVFAPVIAALLVLSYFPERYRAAATLTPSDPESLGLGNTLVQLGALNSVFGKQADVEVALRVATSVETRDQVIKELDLQKRLGDEDALDIHRWLEDRITIRSLRGGIILLETQLHDRELGRDLVGAYAGETRSRLAEITRQQTQYKRQILEKLVSDAGDRLDKAQVAYNAFRLQRGYADPGTSVGAIAARVPALQEAIRTKEVELEAARGVYADNNIVMIQMRTELEALRDELRRALAGSPRAGQGSVGEAVGTSGALFKVERELALARSLYDNYRRYLEGTAVQDLTAEASIRMLEDPHIETERQVWLPALASAVAVFLLWMAVEFYRLRPPVGARIRSQEVETADA